MTRDPFKKQPARSWRDIRQEVKPRAMSPKGRRRSVAAGFRTVLMGLAIIGLAWGGIELFEAVQGNTKAITAGAPAVPVREILLSTDGVLVHAWVVRTLSLPKTLGLLDLDLAKLQERLLSGGQVKAASLTRKFPDTLLVSLSERSPIARLNVQVGDAPPRVLLVARDGVVFAGVNFEPAMLETLPWLDGVKLVRFREGFLPVAGIEVVADLLARARNEAPHLYETWQEVSLARLESDAEIAVRTREVPEIVFSVTDDFFHQLAKLDHTWTTLAQQRAPVKRINLALGRDVTVTLEKPAPAPGRVPGTKGTFNASQTMRNPKETPREF